MPPPLKCFRGSTEGEPLNHTILNMVFDTVLRHWVTVVVLEETGPDGFSQAVQNMAEIFYAAENLLVSTRAEQMKRLFDTLMDLFDRVGLSIDVSTVWLYTPRLTCTVVGFVTHCQQFCQWFIY